MIYSITSPRDSLPAAIAQVAPLLKVFPTGLRKVWDLPGVVYPQPRQSSRVYKYITPALAMARLRAEQSGKDTSQFPPRKRRRVLLKSEKRKENRRRASVNYYRRKHGQEIVPYLEL